MGAGAHCSQARMKQLNQGRHLPDREPGGLATLQGLVAPNQVRQERRIYVSAPDEVHTAAFHACGHRLEGAGGDAEDRDMRCQTNATK